MDSFTSIIYVIILFTTKSVDLILYMGQKSKPIYVYVAVNVLYFS